MKRKIESFIQSYSFYSQQEKASGIKVFEAKTGN